jgi:hypothetical protein
MSKKQNIDQLTFNQSIGVINRPMMSNNASTHNNSAINQHTSLPNQSPATSQAEESVTQLNLQR